MIINALGELTNPNVDDVIIDDRVLSEAKASGLTAVNITIGYTWGDFDPYTHTLRELDLWDGLIATHSDHLLQVRSAADLRRAHTEGRIGVIYGFQNAVAVDAERVPFFADRGVRVIQLTYNQANHLGGGSMAPENLGLTDLGHSTIAALNDHSLMVDLSHSGRQTCLQATRASRQPVSINHTGCRALTDLPRNKTDEELRLVADRGGFVGIYFMPFLALSGDARAADVVEHIVHAVDVCGEDAVGIGTDGPITTVDDLDAYRTRLAVQQAERADAGAGAAGELGALPFVVDLRGVDQFRQLVRLLEQRGFREERIAKIMGGNFLAYASRIWA
ncbi:peptidase M19 [Lentzea sp. NBRC 105346]|uniref:dipeptidase n=1 Tax=Lentzea sp. NBRC 105346 TaxID=3032205 RepID=UPI0024A016F2|nr:membrane dipeptidase [Lentzea sp. NBRC 105346]GLZ35343.1 peptidase M19 [Lentzea sp. NBRC 105346]